MDVKRSSVYSDASAGKTMSVTESHDSVTKSHDSVTQSHDSLSAHTSSKSHSREDWPTHNPITGILTVNLLVPHWVDTGSSFYRWKLQTGTISS